MANNYTELFRNYISLTKEYERDVVLKESTSHTFDVLNKLTNTNDGFSYDDGKWTTNQLLSHIIDTERILSYRALRYARQDQTQLPGFDEDHYAKHAGAQNRSIESLVKEFKAVRASTLLLFESFTNEMFMYSGSEKGKGLTVEKLLRIIAGHSMHHSNILVERYGV